MQIFKDIQKSTLKLKVPAVIFYLFNNFINSETTLTFTLFPNSIYFCLLLIFGKLKDSGKHIKRDISFGVKNLKFKFNICCKYSSLFGSKFCILSYVL